MTFRQFCKRFGPAILESAARRWPDEPCTVYALGLQDPLGRLIASTLHAVGLAPNLFQQAPPGTQDPVIAGAVRAEDLRNVLKALTRADVAFALDGEPPLAPDAEELRAKLEEISNREEAAFLIVAGGMHEVLRLDDSDEIATPGLFGGLPIVGRA